MTSLPAAEPIRQQVLAELRALSAEELERRSGLAIDRLLLVPLVVVIAGDHRLPIRLR